MKKFAFLALMAAFLFGGRAFAVAETLTHPEAKVEITFPDEWKHETEGDKLLLHDEKKEVVVYLEVLKAKDLKEAADHLAEEIKDEVEDVKVEKEDTTEHNGMHCEWIHATGKHGDEKLHIFVDFIVTPSNHILMCLGTIHESDWEKHEKDLQKVYDDIKPAK